MREDPKELQVYKHFKGNLYQIITIAVHSETGEKLVIYRPLYDSTTNYARPLEMFMSEVDHVKYPDVMQKYRFELLGGEKECSDEQTGDTSECERSSSDATEAVVDAAECVEGDGVVENAEDSADAETIQIDPQLEKFLDASTYHDKLECFYMMKKTATSQILSYVAMALDIELSKETVEEQYAEILYCLKTMEKYECTRLRP